MTVGMQPFATLGQLLMENHCQKNHSTIYRIYKQTTYPPIAIILEKLWEVQMEQKMKYGSHSQQLLRLKKNGWTEELERAVIEKDNGFHEQNGLVWGNVKEMLNFGIGIAFHDVMATDINNPNDILAHYEIAQNIILNRLGRGCKMLAEPNGNKNYVEAAHNYPVIKTFTLQTGGERIHPFEEMLNLENKLIERIFFNNHDEIKEKIVNELSYPCEQREIIYAGVHGTDTSWAEFLLWLNDTYGQDGDDSMWMPNQEEYYEYNYYQVHGTTEVNYENEHTIKLTVHLPGQEYFYYPSVTVNLSGIKKEDIKQISSNDEVTGLSFANYENGIMLNIDCRKYLAEHAENFVKRYETNPTSVSAKADALYFVNMLKDSDKKTELKKRVE